jgi:4-alpha-glucanotransferase
VLVGRHGRTPLERRPPAPPLGTGDLGPDSIDFVDFLAETGQRWWQILPLGPTGAGHSPYPSYSSFAGNSLLVGPEAMARAGWLSESDWAGLPEFPADRVDFDAARHGFQADWEVPAAAPNAVAGRRPAGRPGRGPRSRANS